MPRFPKRTLHVHVGLPKTGSTSIQRMLYALSPSLEQVGVHLVATSCYRGRHLLTVPNLPEGARDSRILAYRWQNVFEEVRRCAVPRLLITSEVFSRPRERASIVQRFVALAQAAKLDVEVIVCVRPQWQWLEASYTERVFYMGALPPFAEWLQTGLTDDRLDFARTCAPWRDAFGQVTVIPVERSRLPDGLLTHFLGALGVDDAGIVAAAQRMPRRNRRRRAKSLEILRLLSGILQDQGVQQWQRINIRRRLPEFAALFDDDTPFTGLSWEQIDSITNLFAAANARFARDYGVAADGALFPAASKDDLARPNCVNWRELSDSERLAATDLVRHRLGLILPDGVRVRPGARSRAGEATFEDRVADLAAPTEKTMGKLTSAGLAMVIEILRGLARIRTRVRCVPTIRWLRFQFLALLHWAREVAGVR